MIKRIYRAYRVMNREEYRENMKLAMLAKFVNTLEMPDLLAPDGGLLKKQEKVVLLAVPENPIRPQTETQDPLYQTLFQYKPELIYLQISPMHFITKQRYLSYQLALKGQDEYQTKATYSLDNPIPLSWQECIVNLLSIDMLMQNARMSQINLSKGLACYSYQSLQDYRDHQALTPLFIQTISKEILGNQLSKYHYINQALYLALMGKCKVLLGDMPEQLLRMQLGNTIPINTVRDMYSFVLDKVNQHYVENPGVPISMQEITLMYFPHIFMMPRDLYLTAMLKQAFPAVNQTAALVGAPHYTPIQRYWVGPPAGINYTQATYIPPKIPNETPEMLIEKQVLFDLLLDSKVWGQKYLVNPFPYIAESLDDLSKENTEHFKNYFKRMITQYSLEREEKLKLPDVLLSKQ